MFPGLQTFLIVAVLGGLFAFLLAVGPGSGLALLMSGSALGLVLVTMGTSGSRQRLLRGAGHQRLRRARRVA